VPAKKNQDRAKGEKHMVGKDSNLRGYEKGHISSEKKKGEKTEEENRLTETRGMGKQWSHGHSSKSG